MTVLTLADFLSLVFNVILPQSFFMISALLPRGVLSIKLLICDLKVEFL